MGINLHLMKLLLVISMAVLSWGSFTGGGSASNSKLYGKGRIEDSVYICCSAASYAYHSSLSCRGLDRCTHTIIKVSMEAAVFKFRHRACKICE